MNRFTKIGQMGSRLFVLVFVFLLISAEDAPKTLTVQGVVDGFKKAVTDKKNLTVKSTQVVTYTKKESGSVSTTSSVTVNISADMKEKSFVVKMTKVDPQGSAAAQPNLILVLEEKGGKAVFTEKHWYEKELEYRTVSYEIPDSSGVHSLEVDSALFSSLQTRVCATAEFFHTWLDQPYLVDGFINVMCEAVSVTDEKYQDKRKELYPEGRDAYRLNRPVYDTVTKKGRSSRTDTFWFDKTSLMLIGWKSELLSTNNGVEHSQLVERSYSYQ